MSIMGDGKFKAIQFCCEEFKNECQGDEHITYDHTTNTWNVHGCCGGNCYVLNNIKHCPYCGDKLPHVKSVPVRESNYDNQGNHRGFAGIGKTTIKDGD